MLLYQGKMAVGPCFTVCVCPQEAQNGQYYYWKGGIFSVWSTKGAILHYGALKDAGSKRGHYYSVGN